VKTGDSMELACASVSAAGVASPAADKVAVPAYPAQRAHREGSATARFLGGLATLTASVNADGTFDAKLFASLQEKAFKTVPTMRRYAFVPEILALVSAVTMPQSVAPTEAAAGEGRLDTAHELGAAVPLEFAGVADFLWRHPALSCESTNA
jgi:hypothetical protein